MITPTQLTNDLKLIDAAIARSADIEGLKRAVSELVDWNRGHVGAHAAVIQRVSVSEAALDELIGGGEEGLMPETATTIITALEQSRAINLAFRNLVERADSPLDDLTKHQFLALLKNSDQQISASVGMIQDLIFEVDEDGEGDGGGEDADEDDEDDEDDHAVESKE